MDAEVKEVKEIPVKKERFTCPYYDEDQKICVHPRCIRGCGKDCKNMRHVTKNGDFIGDSVWTHR